MNMDKRIYKILVVDDEKDFRDTLKMLFDYEGYETKCVSSGQEALGTLRNEQFSIVVTDMMMDGMDGLELLSQIKAQGAVYCDCPACAVVEAILAKKGELL